jgi:hypothetical protein
MDVVAKLDEHGRSAWLAVMILSFIIFWPVGIAVLGYMIWSGRMGCEKQGGAGRWWNMEKRRARRNGGDARTSGYKAQTSGNAAFDEYREETLRRLQDEQEGFVSFLDRLRHAKDKAEFDQFMSERKDRPTNSEYDGADNDGARNGNTDNDKPQAPAPA